MIECRSEWKPSEGGKQWPGKGWSCCRWAKDAEEGALPTLPTAHTGVAPVPFGGLLSLVKMGI